MAGQCSTRNVAEGAQLVATTKASLARIVATVRGIQALTDETARFAGFQSINLTELNTAVDQFQTASDLPGNAGSGVARGRTHQDEARAVVAHYRSRRPFAD